MDLAEARERNFGLESRHPWETARLDVVRRLGARHLASREPAVVLDVGCGDTFVSEQLSAAYPRADVHAVDIAFTDELVATFQARLGGSRVHLYRSIDALPAFDPPVSLVLLMDVIEHIEDPVAFLRHLVSQPYVTRETMILITVPAFQSLFCSHDTFLGHYRRYSNSLLRRHVEASGLRVDDIGYFFFSLLPLRLLRVAKERLVRVKRDQATTGLVGWHGSAAVANALHHALALDARVSLGLKRLGITLAGLSNYAICHKA